MALVLVLVAMVVLAGVAYGGSRASTQRVVVQPGQTLWAIARARYPGDDVRERVAEIEVENHLAGGSISPGETLILPAP